ncbi:probable acetolactate synthase 2, chloroplastic [Triticum aestivum]|uniref:probable acetolactate synthase 2, chloroplastic n=1 Tax=Triticum aestivum TaxID=4565 RepID=UPI001D007907|nr:probable acetolactate synthase 2, chloroplastic [Triticum aestivum]XP_044414627.1 probable acetolactate synthase 2, chloroplastic [Triticum aestivum]
MASSSPTVTTLRRNGADILVEALERCGVGDVFAYPGGASMEIHQELTRSPTIRTHLLRHEQGEAFAASGYARASGRPGVCIATSGPGATNLVTALADAYLDSVLLDKLEFGTMLDALDGHGCHIFIRGNRTNTSYVTTRIYTIYLV